MLKEIIVNVTAQETRVGILEKRRLVELLIEKREQERLVGNIYRGRVVNVVSGVQAAFIDIGDNRKGFLPRSEIVSPSPPGKSWTKIQEILKKGEWILVQVIKEEIGQKYPKLTTSISLPGKYLVLCVSPNGVGVSHRVQNEQKRQWLKKFLNELKPSDIGVIARSESIYATPEALEVELNSLVNTWREIKEKFASSNTPSLLWQELPLLQQVARDFLSQETDKLVIDTPQEYQKLRDYTSRISPLLQGKIKLYKYIKPIFTAFGLERQIDEIFNQKISLKCGGYITIQETEALTAIDVNTGRYTGVRSSTLETTALKVNLEAAEEIAIQLRLRNIGGIIIIDFVELREEKNKRLLARRLKELLARDRARNSLSQFTELGIIEMTRQRKGQSTFALLSQQCECCKGLGRIPSGEFLAGKIARALKELTHRTTVREVVVKVSAEVVSHFRHIRRELKLPQMEKEFNVKITVLADSDISLPTIRVLPLKSGQPVY